MNSWPLMLILWYARRRREEAPPSSLCGTLLCRRGKNRNRKMAGRELGIQTEALSTLYFLLVELKVNLLVLLLHLLPSSHPDLLPSFLPSFLFGPVMSLLPRCCGVTGRQRLLLAASPVDTVVMSLPPDSTIGHPRPPQWAASLVYSFGEWGVSHGRTVRRFEAKPPRSAPLHAPAEVND
ncbi:hypothetical protein Q8A73_015908 [Channa argus]|nr:hypothetical protein Q8A73_015908 [Channa argus]